MKSLQNLALLQNLYRLQILGFEYVDHFNPDTQQSYEDASSIEDVQKTIQNCHLCDLSKSRTQSMSGQGSIDASLFIVDFTVSQAQDSSANYYAGRSGDILRKMIENVLHFSVDDVYLTHVVKCKPFAGEEPSVSTLQSCKGYLFTQLHLIKPKVIVTLGKEAYTYLSGDTQDFEHVRGHVITFEGAKLIPIYHPQFLLRNPEYKKITLNDLKTIKSCL